MPRLPEPGKDAGEWGDILNEYLNVSLGSDGTLKTDTVGATQLKSSSVTNAAIATGTIQENKLHADVQTKLNSVGGGAVTSVAAKTGAVTLNKSDVGLNNVDNTSDLNKPISTATQTALNGKQASGSYATSSDLTTGLSSKADSSTLTSGLASKVNTSSVGAASGVASLGSDAKLPENQLPTRLGVTQLNATIESAVTTAVDAIEPVPGPEGPQGPKGDTGETGAIGLTGPAGNSEGNPSVIIVTSDVSDTPTQAVTKINVALSAAVTYGIKRQVKLVGAFIINTPLIIQSNTVLDARDATITGATVSAGARRNLIENRATSTVQRTLTADMTAGSTTVTATAGSFTSADVGRTIIIPGAGGLGQAATYGSTVGTILSQAGTTAVIDHAAYNDVTAATARVYDRDSDITIIGGVWNRGTSATTSGNQWNVHDIVMRRVDNLTMDSMRVEADHGKYLFHLADLTYATIRNIRLNNTSSDGIHFNGPLNHITVRDVKGHTHDDTVAVTARDWDSYNDSQGDVNDVLFQSVDGVGGTAALLKIIGGRGVKISNVRAIDFKGNKACGASIKDDGVGPTDISDVILENWHVTLTGATRGSVETGVTDGKVLSINNMYYDGPAGAPLLRQTGGEWDVLTVANAGMSNPIDNSRTFWIEGAIGKLKATQITHRGVGTTTGASFLYAAGGGTNIGIAQLSDVSMEAGDTLIHAAANSTMPKVQVHGFEASGCRRILTAASSVDLSLFGFGGSLAAQAIRIEATAVATLRGSGVRNDNAFAPTSKAAGGILNVYNEDWALSLVDAAKVAGGRAYNSNATLSCGVGLCYSDGAVWKNVISGATY